MFDELHVSGFNESLDQLLAQADELVAMRNRKPVLLGNHAHFFALDVEEVDVGREGAEEVEDVVATVVADDAFALDRRHELHGFVFVVENAMRVDLQCLAEKKKRWGRRW